LANQSREEEGKVRHAATGREDLRGEGAHQAYNRAADGIGVERVGENNKKIKKRNKLRVRGNRTV